MHAYRVSFESHRHAVTIYMSGWLCEAAALRGEEIVRSASERILTIRVDLRAVDFIDPSAFVRLARSLGRWRDAGRGRVTLEFPARSERHGHIGPAKREARSQYPILTSGSLVSQAH